MDMKIKEQAQEHVDALKAIAERGGMSVEELVESVMGSEEATEMEGEEGEMEEEGMEEQPEAGPDRAKIALIVSKLKKPKGE
jgi:hypothetical protein